MFFKSVKSKTNTVGVKFCKKIKESETKHRLTQSERVGQTRVLVPEPVTLLQVAERFGDDAPERRAHDAVVARPF